MLDGAAKVSPLFNRVADLGMPAVAVTDHGNMFGADAFYQESLEHDGVKPIIGIEAYVAPASRFHKKPVFWGTTHDRTEGNDVSGSGAYTHMTMLAENVTGLRNLFALSTRAYKEGYYRNPRMDRDLIAEYADGIIATTGCPGGEVQTRLRLGQPDEAMEAAATYLDIFGEGNFFVELMDHGLKVERQVREGLLEIAEKLSLPVVGTNDSHYVTPDQAEPHAALLCIQTGKTLSDPTRFKLDGEGYYLKSAAEMRETWDKELPEAADNTLLIAERVGSYEEVFAHRDRMPVFKIPKTALQIEAENQLGAEHGVSLPVDALRVRVEEVIDVAPAEIIGGLRERLADNPGSVPMWLVVCHGEHEVALSVTGYPVALSGELLRELNSAPGVTVA
jgi:DNA polymerase-3 subunit alpha